MIFQALVSRVEGEDSFFRKYLSVIRNVLKAFPIEESQETLEAHMPAPQDACEVMARMHPTSAIVFKDEFYLH